MIPRTCKRDVETAWGERKRVDGEDNRSEHRRRVSEGEENRISLNPEKRLCDFRIDEFGDLGRREGDISPERGAGHDRHCGTLDRFEGSVGIADSPPDGHDAVVADFDGGVFEGDFIDNQFMSAIRSLVGDERHVMQVLVGFGQDFRIDRPMADAVCEAIERRRIDDARDIRVALVDCIVNHCHMAWQAALFHAAFVDDREVGRADLRAIGILLIDQKGIGTQAQRDDTCRGGEQSMIDTAFEVGADTFGSVDDVRRFCVCRRRQDAEEAAGAGAIEEKLFVGQLMRFSDHGRADFGSCGEFERIEPEESFVQGCAAATNAVAFEDDRVASGDELFGHAGCELLGAGFCVGGETDVPGAAECLREETSARGSFGDGERHAAWGMGVNDCADIGTGVVDGAVKRVFGGRLVPTDAGAIGLHANHIARQQAALVDIRRRDPHISVFIETGNIAAGGVGQMMPINPGHRNCQLFSGMDIRIRVHIGIDCLSVFTGNYLISGKILANAVLMGNGGAAESAGKEGFCPGEVVRRIDFDPASVLREQGGANGAKGEEPIDSGFVPLGSSFFFSYDGIEDFVKQGSGVRRKAGNTDILAEGIIGGERFCDRDESSVCLGGDLHCLGIAGIRIDEEGIGVGGVSQSFENGVIANDIGIEEIESAIGSDGIESKEEGDDVVSGRSLLERVQGHIGECFERVECLRHETGDHVNSGVRQNGANGFDPMLQKRFAADMEKGFWRSGRQITQSGTSSCGQNDSGNLHRTGKEGVTVFA